MSELRLSTQLVNDVQAVLLQHDEAAVDPGVTSQYLCAVIGFLLGQQEMSADEKEDVLNQLSAFMKHVANDVDLQRQQAATAPPPPPQEAFGIWKPKS